MIRVERHDELPGVGELILDRPEKRNALNERGLRDLSLEAGALAADDSIRAVVLRGEGPVFCAGFDLAPVVDEPELLGGMLDALAEACLTLKRLRVPVVVAAHGAALAGGCALVASCDFVVTHQTAKLGYPVVTIGVSPAISAPALAGRVGAGVTRQRLLDPTFIDGLRARAVRLADLCVDIEEDTIPRAQLEAKRFADKPAHAVQRTKAWLNEVEGADTDAAANAARDASLALVGNHEQRELLARVMAKRKK